MNIGILLIANLLIVPLLYEAEMLDESQDLLSALRSIFTLKKSRKEKWFWALVIFTLILTAIAVSPSRSGASYEITMELVVVVGAFQLIAWAYIGRKIVKIMKEKKNVN